MKRSFYAATAALGLSLILAGAGLSTTATAASKMKAISSASVIAQGKALASQYGCNRCHGADFHGKPGRTPNITATGELKNYNPTTFATLLSTGVEHDGKHLKGMPVMHLPASKADAIYAYLKTVK